VCGAGFRDWLHTRAPRAHVRASEHRYIGRTQDTGQQIGDLRRIELSLYTEPVLVFDRTAALSNQACVCFKAHIGVVLNSLDVALSIVSGRAASTNGLAHPGFSFVVSLLLIGCQHADKKSPTPDDLITPHEPSRWRISRDGTPPGQKQSPKLFRHIRSRSPELPQRSSRSSRHRSTPRGDKNAAPGLARRRAASPKSTNPHVACLTAPRAR